jgi:hypothetical protein
MAAIPRDYIFKKLRLPVSSRSMLSKDFLDAVFVDQVVSDGGLSLSSLF